MLKISNISNKFGEYRNDETTSKNSEIVEKYRKKVLTIIKRPIILLMLICQFCNFLQLK